MDYKQAAFELAEKILMDYNIYSEIYMYILEYLNKTLHEYFVDYYDAHFGSIENFIQNTSKFPKANLIWIEGLNNLKKKYERGV